MLSPIRVGIIGYGSSAKTFQLPFILPNPDLQIHAFLQRAEAPGEAVEAGKHCTVDHPRAKHYRTAEDFFSDAEIDLVVVCTHHDTHATFAEQALLAGKHVVVEKPFTVTSAEANKLIQHLISFRNPLGKITEFENHYDVDNPPWIHKDDTKKNDNSNNEKNASTPQPGDGLLYGLGSHSIDQTLLLFGRPQKITAFTRSLLVSDGAVDDFTIVLQYHFPHQDQDQDQDQDQFPNQDQGGEQKQNRNKMESNLLATIKTTVVTPGLPRHKSLKFRVLGTDGTFHKWGEDVQIEHLLSGVKVDDDDATTTSEEKFGVEPERYHGELSVRSRTRDERERGDEREGEQEQEQEQGKGRLGDGDDGDEGVTKVKSLRGSYLDYYRDVVAAIRGEKEVVVKAEEARDVIRLIELAMESAETGRTVEWREV